jgi:hypothetical protein
MRGGWLGMILAVAVGVSGYFGPWVPHKAAGLVVTGVDLAEYVKFLPQVASGQIPLRREIFYLPLIAASVGACLAASRRALPVLIRVLLGLAAIPLALAMLPPAWSPAVLALPEFRLQILAIGLCLLLLPGVAIIRLLPERLLLMVLTVLAVAAACAPAWGFLQVHPVIVTLYRHPLPLGLGFWACTAGFAGAAVVAMAEAIRR